MDFEDKMNRPAPPVVTQLPSKYTPIKMIVNSLVHMMVGIVVYVVWKVALQTYSGKFQLHILFNVLAYQLFLIEAVLSFTGESWTTSLGRRKKKIAHMCLTITGSICGIVGISLAMSFKSTHFTSTHGIFGLITLIFTCLSVLNGFATFFDSALGLSGKRFLITKCLHTFMGTMSIIFGIVTLILGMNKDFFILSITKEVSICVTIFSVLILGYTIIMPIKNIMTYVSNMRSTAL